jgi:hypothetical protein
MFTLFVGLEKGLGWWQQRQQRERLILHTKNVQ